MVGLEDFKVYSNLSNSMLRVVSQRKTMQAEAESKWKIIQAKLPLLKSPLAATLRWRYFSGVILGAIIEALR